MNDSYVSLFELDLDLDFDLPPILALHIAYGFLAPPLLFTFVTHLSNFFVLSPFFLTLWHIHHKTLYIITIVPIEL